MQSARSGVASGATLSKSYRNRQLERTNPIARQRRNGTRFQVDRRKLERALEIGETAGKA